MSNKIEYNHSTITLKDGRQLGYIEYGTSIGYPIFYFHGLPGSRMDASHLHKLALLDHHRLIAIDRPGMGLSSFSPQRTILSWADDMVEFADSLKIDKFSIIGHSGGAPFVVACTYKIPHRLYGAAIVSGMAPFEYIEATTSLARGQRLINSVIKLIPSTATALMKINSFMMSRPAMVRQMLKQLPEVDRGVIENNNNVGFIDSIQEAFRQGVSGVSYEIQLTLKPWGFKLEDIHCPLTIWQGGLDKQAPRAHAELYASLIPSADLRFFKNEGHLSLLVNRGADILKSVCPKV